MSIPKLRAPLLAALLALAPVGHPFAQELRPIGTLTIAEVTDQPVQVFSAGLSYSTPAATGGGAAPTKVTFSTFAVTKAVDATSPRLLVNAASGRVLTQARIDLFDSAGTSVLTSYELTNVLVLGAVVKSAQLGTAQALIEEVLLDYQRIKQTVTTPTGPVEACWDRAQNAPC